MAPSFVDRLLEQRMLMFRLNADYDHKQHQIKALKDEEERLAILCKEAEEEHKLVDQLRRGLETRQAESESRYQAAQEEDQKLREAAAAEMREEMKKVHEMLEIVSEQENKANADQQMTKKKLEILHNFKNTGSTNFDEAVKERDERVAALKQSLEAQIAVKPQVEELIAKADEKLAESLPRFESLKEMVEERKRHFDVLREKLDSSKAFYEEAAALKDRQKKALESLQNDVDLAVSRMEKAQLERNTQERRVHGLEEKIDTVQRQIIQLTKTTNALLGKEASQEDTAAMDVESAVRE